VRLTSGTHQAVVSGIVDSGADGTLMPMGVARLLGIDAGLTPKPANAGAAGGQGFPIWRSEEPLQCQVLALLDTSPQPWGPVFRVVPAFAETSMPLLGRADFFKVFTVTFEQDRPGGPVFHLDV
jgi:hypothetical protein